MLGEGQHETGTGIGPSIQHISWEKSLGSFIRPAPAPSELKVELNNAQPSSTSIRPKSKVDADKNTGFCLKTRRPISLQEKFNLNETFLQSQKVAVIQKETQLALINLLKNRNRRSIQKNNQEKINEAQSPRQLDRVVLEARRNGNLYHFLMIITIILILIMEHIMKFSQRNRKFSETYIPGERN